MNVSIGARALLFVVPTALALAATAAISGGAPERIAQAGGHQQHGAHASPPSSSSASASARAFETANAKMHQGMTIKFTGNADVDFVRGMIPHHEGAVDMARIVLEHGKDPAVRKLAREIIAAQEKEISWMKQWLAKNAK